jgi:hypothetical protein
MVQASQALASEMDEMAGAEGGWRWAMVMRRRTASALSSRDSEMKRRGKLGRAGPDRSWLKKEEKWATWGKAWWAEKILASVSRMAFDFLIWFHWIRIWIKVKLEFEKIWKVVNFRALQTYPT